MEIDIVEELKLAQQNQSVEMQNDIDTELDQVQQTAVESSVLSATFRCNKCGRSFKTNKQLVGHKSKSHKRGLNVTQPGDFPCGECHKRFKLLRALQGHQRIHSNRNVQVTSNTNYNTMEEDQQLPSEPSNTNYNNISDEYQQPAAAPVEMETTNDTTLYEVAQSSNAIVEIDNDTILAQVQQLAVDTSAVLENFQCNKCGKGFKTNKQLVGHESKSHKFGKKIIHPDGEYSCISCLRKFTYFRALQAHQRMHPRIFSSNNLKRNESSDE